MRLKFRSNKPRRKAIRVKSIVTKDIQYNTGRYGCGHLVKIRPCGEEYENKTYLGILLGNLPLDFVVSYSEEDEILTVSSFQNPGIYVPALKKIIFGAESFWGRISTEDELKDITDSDIENVWYIKEILQYEQMKREE